MIKEVLITIVGIGVAFRFMYRFACIYHREKIGRPVTITKNVNPGSILDIIVEPLVRIVNAVAPPPTPPPPPPDPPNPNF